ncbi:hypothetical protein ACLB2K_062748 [Fragaria x ananassa]
MSNDIVDEVNKRKHAFKEQHPDATEDEIMESVQFQQIEQLQEAQERYEQRLKESEERECALHAKSMYSVVQSQVAAIYEHLGMPPPPPPQSSPPPQAPQNNDEHLGDNQGLDENGHWHW